MAVPRNRPTFIAGTPRSSGAVQTGEVRWTRGGDRVASFLSGVGASQLIWSGGGRLNSVLLINHAAITSGTQTLFYDSAIAVSGGPLVTSGHKVIASIPVPTSPLAGSGTLNPNWWPGAPIQVDMPFQSGLCVGVTLSGSHGFSVSFSTETNDQDGGALVG